MVPLGAINPAAVPAEPGAYPKGQLLIDGRAESRAGLKARVAALGVAQFRAHVTTGARKVRLWSDKTYRTALGPRSKQRPLRTPQDFNAIEIEHLWERVE